MINGRRVVAVIPARGGSKSVPGKNIKLLGEKPLLAWSVEVALQVSALDRVIVSTDDEKIAEVARKYGAEVFARLPALATDHSLVIDTLRDLYKRLSADGETADIMVLLEPTCPLRSAQDIENCLQLIADGCDSAATFKGADLHPHRAWRITEGEPEVFVPGAIPWLPRQQLPHAYQLNGAVYAFGTGRLTRSEPGLLFGRRGAVVMPPERSVDIDGPIDFIVAEEVLREYR